MHKDRRAAADLLAEVVSGLRSSPSRVEVIVAPAFPFLEMAAAMVAEEGVRVAAQNCHQEPQGAYTGEVSAAMLHSIGVDHCIVGHSERRQYYGESDDVVGRKVAALVAQGITPIYCCGESLEERDREAQFDVVATQLHAALAGQDHQVYGRLVVAYEPVWAIGTGRTATAAQAQEMHAFIRSELVTVAGEEAHDIPILYGGSCKPENAPELFACTDVNGGLIGGASLEASSFLELVRIAETVMA